MSRGFVKEEDQEDIPIVPPRAELPEGVTNYVTRVGMEELLTEKQSMLDEKQQLHSINENERRIALNFINARLQLLERRIAEARVVELDEQPQDEVRFGATVRFIRVGSSAERSFQIVGVDEADISKGKISFLSPLARALANKKAGDKAILKRGTEESSFEILEISY